VDLPVDADARVPLGLQLSEEIEVLALAASDERRQHLEARALIEREHLVDDLLRGLSRDGVTADGAVRASDTGVEKAEVPTVERGFRDVDFWSIETAGDRPSMKSTSGLSICPRNWRA
jgi:hypothetical protein